MKIERKLVLMPSGTPNREERECIPAALQKGSFDSFLLKDRRIFPLEKIVLLSQVKRGSAPIPVAKVEITNYTHQLINKIPYTTGVYEIKEVL